MHVSVQIGHGLIRGRVNEMINHVIDRRQDFRHIPHGPGGAVVEEGGKSRYHPLHDIGKAVEDAVQHRHGEHVPGAEGGKGSRCEEEKTDAQHAEDGDQHANRVKHPAHQEHEDQKPAGYRVGDQHHGKA